MGRHCYTLPILITSSWCVLHHSSHVMHLRQQSCTSSVSTYQDDLRVLSIAQKQQTEEVSVPECDFMLRSASCGFVCCQVQMWMLCSVPTMLKLWGELHTQSHGTTLNCKDREQAGCNLHFRSRVKFCLTKSVLNIAIKNGLCIETKLFMNG